MTAEHHPLSFVNQFNSTADLTQTHSGHYRSKLFIAPYGTNTLVAAAGPLLSLLERLCLSPSLPPVEHLRENIEHELRAFYSRLKTSKNPDEIISLAYYLLAATTDELLGKNYLRVFNRSSDFKAFTPYTTHEAPPQQLFFEILRYIKERPNQFLDLIELTYFCLIAGFEGQYHVKADGRQVLDNMIEDLYQVIQQYRVHRSFRLYSETPLPKIAKKKL